MSVHLASTFVGEKVSITKTYLGLSPREALLHQLVNQGVKELWV
jgi:hypothetical protein